LRSGGRCCVFEADAAHAVTMLFLTFLHSPTWHSTCPAGCVVIDAH
jgi:hypothetical protein